MLHAVTRGEFLSGRSQAETRPVSDQSDAYEPGGPVRRRSEPTPRPVLTAQGHMPGVLRKDLSLLPLTLVSAPPTAIPKRSRLLHDAVQRSYERPSIHRFGF